MNCTKYTSDVIADALEACHSADSCRACPLRSDKPACCRLNRTAAEVIRELAKQVKELEAASRWISVSERLPNTGDREEIEVLVVINGSTKSTALFFSGKTQEDAVFYAYDPIDGTIPYSVTHWRPMPAGITPPAGRGGERE